MGQQPLRVLIVDDEQSLREPLKKFLNDKYDFDVETAANALEAKAKVKRSCKPFDVILIDEVLIDAAASEGQEQSSGIELMVAIKEETSYSECIVFTGWATDHVRKALHAGAYRCLAKSTSPDELAITLQLAAEHGHLKRQLRTNEQEKEWLKAFLRLGRATSSLLSLNEVLEEVHTQLDRLMKFSGLDVFLYDKASNIITLELSVNNGKRNPKNQDEFEGSTSLTNWVIETGKPCLIQDCAADVLPRPLNTRFYDSQRTKSWLGVPLLVKERSIGAIIVHSPLANQFKEIEQNLLTAVAGQIAMAIQNTRLVSSLHQESEQLGALTQSSFDAIIAIDTNNLVKIFNHQAEKMLGWTAREMLGSRVNILYQNIEDAREVYTDLSKGGHIKQRNIQLKHRDGTVIPTRFSGVLLKDEQGNPIGQAGFMHDLRQVKLLEVRQQALMKVSRIVTESLSQHEVLNKVVEEATNAFPAASSGSIHLYDSQKKLLCIGATTFDFSPDALLALQLKPGEGLAGWVYQHNKAVIANDVQKDKRFKKIEHDGVNEHIGIICVPLKVKDKSLGALWLSKGKEGEFQNDDLELLTSFADQAAVAIENARLFEESERRSQILAALDEASRHIRGQKETGKLLQETVRLAAELANCTMGALFKNHVHSGLFELESAYSLEIDPETACFAHGNGLMRQAVQSGQISIHEDYGKFVDKEAVFKGLKFKMAIALPLIQSGKVTAILFLASEDVLSQPSDVDVDILRRFSKQAMIALNTSRLLNQEQHILSQMAVLHAISDYIQANKDLNKILHVILTGITAGFGLGYNRAALFLLDEKGHTLNGRMGIGHLDEINNRHDWDVDEQKRVNSLEAYLARLEADDLPVMPVGKNIQTLTLPIHDGNNNLFSQVVLDREPIVVHSNEYSRLPQSFVTAFEPAFPLIIVPLIARDMLIGILVADNKFTQSPIDHNDIEALMTFTNSATLAIDNAQMVEQIQSDRDRLLFLLAGSNALISSKEPEQLLNIIVENAREASNADWVTLALLDQNGKAKALVVTDESKPSDVSKIFRPNGLSKQVMDSSEPVIIENSALELERVNPIMFQNGIAAAACLPLSLQDENIGVVWFHYNHPRHFAELEIKSLQFYVNQAALAFESASRIQALEQMSQTAQLVAQLMTLGNLKDTLDSIVQGIAKALGCDIVTLYNYDQANDWVIFPPELYGAKYPERATRTKGVERDSIVFKMLHHDGIYIVEDTKKEKEFRESRFVQEEKVKTSIVIPLKIGDEKVGVMFANFKKSHQFVEDELKNIEFLAHLAAVAIRNAKLFDQAEERAERLLALHEAGKSITALQDQQAIFQELVNQAPRITKPGKEITSSCLRIIEGDQSRAVAVYPPWKKQRMEETEGSIVNLKERRNGRLGIMGRAALSRQSQMVNDVGKDPDYLQGDWQTQSEIAVPIMSNDRVYAVINVEHEEKHAFDKYDLQALELLASHSSVALQNVRHANLLDASAKVAKEATASLEIEKLLEETVRLISVHFGFYHVGAFLLDEKGEYAVLKSFYPPRDEGEFMVGYQVPVGKGIVGHVAKTSVYYFAKDVRGDPHHLLNPDLPNSLLEMGIPLIAQGNVIGVIDLQSDKVIELSQKDIVTIQGMADQLANAILAATLLQEVQDHLAETRALQQVAVKLTAANDSKEVFAIVAEEAMQITKTMYGSIIFWDAKQEKFGEALTLDSGGIVEPYQTQARSRGGRAREIIDTKKTIVVRDAEKEPNFNPVFLKKGHRASIGTPLVDQEGKAFGVLYARNDKPRDFTEEQIRLFEAFASQAAVALERARRTDEMMEIKAYVGSQTAVDWMKMVSSTWGHSLKREVGIILGSLRLLRKSLTTPLSEDTILKLSQLETTIAGLKELPIAAPLSYEDAIDSISINHLIKTHFDRLWQHSKYQSIGLEYDLQHDLDKFVKVRASREWLKRGLELVNENAVRMMIRAGCIDKRVSIQTKRLGEQIVISLQDSGPGIEEDVLERLFKEPIPKPEGSHGSGMGLILAQNIFQAYRGDIRVENSDDNGTTMKIILPIEK